MIISGTQKYANFGGLFYLTPRPFSCGILSLIPDPSPTEKGDLAQSSKVPLCRRGI